MEHDGDGHANCNWCARYCHQKIGRESEGLRNK